MHIAAAVIIEPTLSLEETAKVVAKSMGLNDLLPDTDDQFEGQPAYLGKIIDGELILFGVVPEIGVPDFDRDILNMYSLTIRPVRSLKETVFLDLSDNIVRALIEGGLRAEKFDKKTFDRKKYTKVEGEDRKNL